MGEGDVNAFGFTSEQWARYAAVATAATNAVRRLDQEFQEQAERSGRYLSVTAREEDDR